MAVSFSAYEVLTVAEKIEANGVRFYESAASLVQQDTSRRKLLELARWEQTHQKTFAELKAALGDRQKIADTFDPDNQAPLYLQALADDNVINPSQDPLGELGESPAYRDILALAIAIEKESIAFYTGMRLMAPDEENRKAIDEILIEEMRHVNILYQEIKQLG